MAMHLWTLIVAHVLVWVGLSWWVWPVVTEFTAPSLIQTLFNVIIHVPVLNRRPSRWMRWVVFRWMRLTNLLVGFVILGQLLFSSRPPFVLAAILTTLHWVVVAMYMSHPALVQTKPPHAQRLCTNWSFLWVTAFQVAMGIITQLLATQGNLEFSFILISSLMLSVLIDSQLQRITNSMWHREPRYTHPESPSSTEPDSDLIMMADEFKIEPFDESHTVDTVVVY